MTGKRNGFLALSYTKKQHQETFSGQHLTLVLRPPCKLLFPQKNAQILHFYGLLALGKGKRVWNTISNETRIQFHWHTSSWNIMAKSKFPRR